ncbi:FAS1 domain-containing protein [Lasiosphaeria miniovina]|uniref:FAS1 domain-containing protein n=1 Tax=Lasiosphaeria miniovina TaxID=1954250 RepID=A0AA40B4J3_9PEZI|nr:FAS1 domain-containing protein [Lasiosphaeria miniovina]KAK0727546.1 FAS1 domain-containing protein [Lasiosphaeria miniovina]
MLSRHLLPLAAAAVGISATTLDAVLDSQNATLSILNNYLTSQQELFNTLINTPNLTILAPSNDAINGLLASEAFSAQLQADPGILTAILKYHIFNGTYYTSNFTGAAAPVFVRTLMDNATYSNVTGGQRVEARAQDGGVAFTSGLREEAAVRTSNFNYTGGTVHVIDSVLAIPANLTATLQAANLTAAIGALRRAGVADSLGSGSEQLTVFAPSNGGFNAVGSLVAQMTAADLERVLGYHVVRGRVMYSDLIAAANGSRQAMQRGGDVEFRAVSDGEVALFVNSARVVGRDLLFDNGVIQVLDNVLNPANTSAAPNPAAATQAPAFSGANTSAGGVPFTSGVPGPSATGAGGAAPTATAAAPARTAALGVVALVGGAAVLVNL